MMGTTHVMVHRMNVFLKRFRARAWEVKVIMQGIRDQEEPSVEVDQTQNPERTDSEDPDEVLIKQDPCDLGLVNAPSVNENQEEEVNNEQSAEKPKEEANNHEPE